MRISYGGKILKDGMDGKVLGIFAAAEYCFEHEQGIKEFEICESIIKGKATEDYLAKKKPEDCYLALDNVECDGEQMSAIFIADHYYVTEFYEKPVENAAHMVRLIKTCDTHRNEDGTYMSWDADKMGVLFPESEKASYEAIKQAIKEKNFTFRLMENPVPYSKRSVLARSFGLALCINGYQGEEVEVC